MNFLEYKVYDILLAGRARPAVGGRVAVVDLDEKSLAEIGQWPWPRYQVALLLSRLKEYGVLAVGMDAVFSEPDRTSPGRIQSELEKLGVHVDFQGLPDDLRDNDRLLAKNIADGPFVLGYFFSFEEDAGALAGESAKAKLPPSRVMVRRLAGAADAPIRIAKAAHVVAPLPALAAAGGWAGFFNSFPDHDNIVRRLPAVISFGGGVYPNLALATLMRAFGGKSAWLTVAPNPYGGQDLSVTLDLGPLGKRSVPLDAGGTALLDYRGPGRLYPYISAVDVMQGRASREALAGKIVFVGASARGLEDVRATPFDQSFPGVEAHATLADMVIQGDFVRHPPDARQLEQVILAVFGLGVTALLMATRSLWAGILSVLAGLGIWFASRISLNRSGFYLSPLSPLLVLGINFTLLTFLKFLREERGKRFVQAAFSHYVAPQVVDEILAAPGKLNLSGEEKEVSILFSDVRGFTSIAETLSPTQVAGLLHEYFTPMTRLITTNRGTLDKFMGDAVMAFWNAPAAVSDHPRLAVTAALAMLDALDALNEGFRARYGFALHIGIGLAAGPVRVGNFGSEDLFDYTIIGDAVNLCSRLESLTKYYRRELLATDMVRAAAGETFAWREVDRVRVAGKHEPVTIHSIDRAAKIEPAIWLEALALYRSRRFTEALSLFEAFHAAGDELSGIYAARCAVLAASPPPADWDGVFDHTAKAGGHNGAA